MKWLICFCALCVCSFLNAQTTPDVPVQENKMDSTLVDEDHPSDSILTFAEVVPEFPGGMPALFAFLGKEIKYPAKARRKKITGKVLVKFIIEKDGSVSNVQTVNKPLACECLEEEAMRVVRLMPLWKPGTQNDKPVRVVFTLPINFSLE